MHGPERLGCVLFGLSNLHWHEVPAAPADTSEPGGFHNLRLSGELFLGITRPTHRLPRNMWDRQRSGGRLSDGTRVTWIIHDINMPGRIGERYFDVVFSRRHFASSTTDRDSSFERWKNNVIVEWWDYVRVGRRRVRQEVRPEFLALPDWESEILMRIR